MMVIRFGGTFAFYGVAFKNKAVKYDNEDKVLENKSN
jgi:hypothetical protein